MLGGWMLGRLTSVFSSSSSFYFRQNLLIGRVHIDKFPFLHIQNIYINLYSNSATKMTTTSEMDPIKQVAADEIKDLDLKDINSKRTRSISQESNEIENENKKSETNVNIKKNGKEHVEKRKRKLPNRKEFVPRSETKSEEPPFEGYIRRPKRKVALLMSYNGKGYHGMQVNKVVPTIEGELFKAFEVSQAVGKENIDDPHKFGFMRAARTDKGVHAATQVVSLKMCVEEENLVEKMNAVLPPQIRIWGFHRTRNSFHAKKQTDSRVYEYLLPTHVFLPVGELWEVNKHSEKIEDPNYHYHKNISEEDIKIMKSYRISKELLESVTSFTKSYEGNRHYHNFTSNSTYKDPRSIRFIRSVNIVGPTIIDGYEWLKVVIHGNSFVLHQIRKMMGLMILSIRCGKAFSDVEYVFEPGKANIPTAPPIGLLLRKTVHDGYNRVAEEAVKLDFDKYEDQVQEFTEKYIYNAIYKETEETSDFYTWNRSLEARSYYYHVLFEKDAVKDIKPLPKDDNGDEDNSGNRSD